MKQIAAPSLLRKIILIGCGCLLLSLWANTLFNIYLTQKDTIRDFQLNAKVLAMRFEQHILEALDWGETYSIVGRDNAEQMNLMLNYPAFRKILTQVGVVDTGGNILAHSDYERISQSISTHALAQLRQGSETMTLQEGGSYDTYLPILHEGHIEGYILIGFTQKVIDAKIGEIIWGSILLTLGTLFFSILIFIFSIKKFITNPLEQLEEHIQYIKESGDLSAKVEMSSKDEIGRLAGHFNEMMEALQQAKDVLKDVILKHEEKEKDERRIQANLSFLLMLTNMLSWQMRLATYTRRRQTAELLDTGQLMQTVQEMQEHVPPEMDREGILDPDLEMRRWNIKNMLKISEDVAHIADAMPELLEMIQNNQQMQKLQEKNAIDLQRAVAKNRHMELALSMEDKSLTSRILGKKKLLVIDHDETFQRVVKDYLNLQYFEVETITNARTCLEVLMAQRYKPDLLMIEINLSGMDGLTLGKKIRSMPAYRYTPILFVSTSRQYSQEALDIGLAGFLAKPLNFMMLDDQIWQTFIFYHYTSPNYQCVAPE